MKKIIAAALVSTFVAGTAFAQSATTPAAQTDSAPAVTAPAPKSATTTPSAAATGTTSGAMVTSIPHLTANQMVSSKVVGTSVYNTNNEKIGEVNDLILDANGKVAGVVIGVGGFLGMGQRNVALDYSSVKFSKDAKGYERITVAATKEQLKSMTPYDTKNNG
jgi:sporulation protein YlmC with PRC-barrel domain